MSKPNRSAEPCQTCGREVKRRDNPYSDALAVLRYELKLDENGDNNCGVEPEAGWETGYCAGLRTAYLVLKNGAPQGNIPARLSEKSPVESPARASSEAGDDARDAARYRRLRENWIECGELQFRGRLAVIDKHVDAAIATAKGSSK